MDLHQFTKDLNLTRYDKSNLTSKVIQKEHRYLALTRQSVLTASQSYQRELSLLKSQLDRDKAGIRAVERKIEEIRRKQGQQMEDVQALDSVLFKGLQSVKSGTDEYRVHGLIQEVDELKKVNRLLQEEKE